MRGYYGLGHRNIEVAHNQSLVEEYVAKIKFTSLFHKKLVFADHMIVNCPNLPLALQKSKDLIEIFQPEIIEIAHFERKADSQKSYATLDELFEFYRRNNALHPKFNLKKFVPDNGIYFFNSINETCTHTYPESTNRDPFFTVECENIVKTEYFKKLLGKNYQAFLTGFEFLKQSEPIFGIIHFDPEHRWPGDKNIYDYIQNKVPRYSTTPIEIIENEVFKTIPEIFRALLVKVETGLLSCDAILPVELTLQQGLVLSDDPCTLESFLPEHKIEVPVSLTNFTTEILANVPVSLIIKLRESDEGQTFLNCDDYSDIKTTSDLVASYTRRINIELGEYFSINQQPKKTDYIIAVSQGYWQKSLKHIDSALTVIIQFLSTTVSPFFKTAEVPLKSATKYMIAMQQKDPDIEAKITTNTTNNKKLTQFSS